MALLSLCRTLAIGCLSLAITPAPAKADMSMIQHGKQGGVVSGTWTRRVRIKGLKMRMDTTQGAETQVIIYDLENGKKYLLNSKRKEVSTVDLKSTSEHMKANLMPERLRKEIRATGKKVEIAGAACDEYTFDLQVPSAPWRGMSVIQHDSGTVCVSRVIPEGIDVTSFVHEAKKRGYTAAAAPLCPTSSAIGFYFYGEEPNVMVLAAKSESGVEGPSMKLHAMSRVELTVSVSDIKSDPVPDEDFQIPSDWKQSKR